mgnify:CR=1 FL=1
MQQISQTHHANPTSCLFQLVPQLCQGEAVQQPPLPRTTLAQRGGVVGAHVAPGAAVALKGQRVQGGSGGQTSHSMQQAKVQLLQSLYCTLMPNCDALHCIGLYCDL